ncbi:MAG: sigma 54-interacting transcriptional regulator [Proteocatella sp.]
MELEKIQTTVQQLAEAISSVIEIDVTVTDRHLVRIAGTGIYKKQIGEKISTNGVFASCLRDNRHYIVRNPREAKVCRNCDMIEACSECAEIVTPITINKDAAGTIGLIAFDDQQKKLLLKNEESILLFLQKMSQMIAATLTEKEKTSEIKILANQLQTIMDVMDKAIIIVDGIGDIKYINEVADTLLDISAQNYKNIHEIINHTNIRPFDIDMKIKNREFEYKNPHGNFTSGIISTRILESEDGVESVVVIIQEMQRLIKSARNIISTNIATPFDNIIYESPVMDKTIKFAQKASQSNSTLLITGESGTGKELFARAIHYQSDRKKEPFIAINCSAIPENLFESELFGYVEGAFTGASKGGHPGKFELAHKGTLLLDEIGEMPLHLQPKLLRVLQDGKVTRVGGSRQMDVDVRIIASTNANLEQKVKDREFREDLYYRLNVIPLHIPPLRERVQDINIITRYFIQKFAKKLDKNVKSIEDGALEIINTYTWQGNIRELENAIEYAVNMSENHKIESKDLPPKLQGQKQEAEARAEHPGSIEHQSQKIRTIEDLEKTEIQKALEHRGANKLTIDDICAQLGIGKATLYRKLKKYDMEIEK